MNTASERDRLSIDYQTTLAEMKGISPTLSTYKNLEKKLLDIKERLGGEGVEFKDFKTTKLNGVIVRKEYKQQQPRPKCAFGGCTKQVRTGGKDRYGNQKFLKYCGEHRTEKRRDRV